MQSPIPARVLLGFFLPGIAAVLFVRSTANADGPKYSVTKIYALGGEGGWDYLKYDTDAHRLFITRGTHVIVVDPETGKQTGEIPDTPGVHGVAFAPELAKGFTSKGRANSVTIFDLKDLHVTGTAKTGEVPDAITYKAVSRRVFHVQRSQPRRDRH